MQLEASTQFVILISSNQKYVNIFIIHKDSKILDISGWENKQHPSSAPAPFKPPISYSCNAIKMLAEVFGQSPIFSPVWGEK